VRLLLIGRIPGTRILGDVLAKQWEQQGHFSVGF
jgi:hypothetical protein